MDVSRVPALICDRPMGTGGGGRGESNQESPAPTLVLRHYREVIDSRPMRAGHGNRLFRLAPGGGVMMMMMVMVIASEGSHL